MSDPPVQQVMPVHTETQILLVTTYYFLGIQYLYAEFAVSKWSGCVKHREGNLLNEAKNTEHILILWHPGKRASSAYLLCVNA